MLMRTDPFRELDRFTQQLLGQNGTWSRPAVMRGNRAEPRNPRQLAAHYQVIHRQIASLYSNNPGLTTVA